MSQQAVLTSLDRRGVATVTLNRPEVNNAYDETLIQGLHAAMDELGAKPALRVVVLRGAGKHFQAGADLKWIRRVAAQDAARTNAYRALPRWRYIGSIRCPCRRSRWCREAASAAAPESSPPATW